MSESLSGLNINGLHMAENVIQKLKAGGKIMDQIKWLQETTDY